MKLIRVKCKDDNWEAFGKFVEQEEKRKELIMFMQLYRMHYGIIRKNINNERLDNSEVQKLTIDKVYSLHKWTFTKNEITRKILTGELS
jgi:hypothetical protein